MVIITAENTLLIFMPYKHVFLPKDDLKLYLEHISFISLFAVSFCNDNAKQQSIQKYEMLHFMPFACMQQLHVIALSANQNICFLLQSLLF